MTNPGDDLVTVELAAGLWSCIDANTDNVVSLAVVDGPEADVEIGDAIRDAGAAQVPWVEGQWPPRDQQIAITLSEGQWQWALHHLEVHARSYERIGDQESLELGRAACTAIRQGLSESERRSDVARRPGTARRAPSATQETSQRRGRAVMRLPRGLQVLLGVLLVLLLAAAIGSACGPNRDAPNPTGDPLNRIAPEATPPSPPAN